MASGSFFSTAWARPGIMLAALLVTGSPAAEEVSGTSVTSDVWQDHNEAGKNPWILHGASLTISTPKTEYYAGERIPVTFCYSNAGPLSYHVSQRPNNREGKEQITWIAVGPDGEPVPDPLLGQRVSLYHRRLPEPLEVSPGVSHCETFNANKWLSFGTLVPGDYELGVISYRAIFPGQAETDYPARLGQGLPSNRIRITIRETSPGEIREVVERLEKVLERECERDPRDVHNVEFIEAGKQLSYLHSITAVPVYIRYKDCWLVSGSMRFGLFGVTDTTAVLTMLREHYANPDCAIIPGDVYQYRRISSKLIPGNNMRFLPRYMQKKTEEELRPLLAGKLGQARMQTLFSFASYQIGPVDHVELARLLPELPEHTLWDGLNILARITPPEAVPGMRHYVEPYLQSSDERIRREAFKTLLRGEEEQYVRRAVEVVLSATSRHGSTIHGSEFPKTLSDDLQVSLALALEHRPVNPEQIMSVLERRATTPAVIRPLRAALGWMEENEYQGIHRSTMQILNQIDPEGAAADGME